MAGKIEYSRKTLRKVAWKHLSKIGLTLSQKKNDKRNIQEEKIKIKRKR